MGFKPQFFSRFQGSISGGSKFTKKRDSLNREAIPRIGETKEGGMKKEMSQELRRASRTAFL